MKNTSQRVCGAVLKNCLVAALKGYSRMVKNEEDGLGPVNRKRGTRPHAPSAAPPWTCRQSAWTILGNVVSTEAVAAVAAAAVALQMLPWP